MNQCNMFSENQQGSPASRTIGSILSVWKNAESIVGMDSYPYIRVSSIIG